MYHYHYITPEAQMSVISPLIQTSMAAQLLWEQYSVVCQQACCVWQDVKNKTKQPTKKKKKPSSFCYTVKTVRDEFRIRIIVLETVSDVTLRTTVY